MISVIICSRLETDFNLVRRNVLRTAGDCDLEVIRIDNTNNTYGICAAYNQGVLESKGNILVFMHEDVFHLEFGWGRALENKFASEPSLGILGVAGTQVLVASPPLWSWAGRPYLFGKVVHELDEGNRFFMTVFSTDSGEREVVAVDGCWFAIRREVFDSCHFDAETFPGFHFYDLDFCMQARLRWKILASTQILIKHCSPGSFDEAWKNAAQSFRTKWGNQLPATTSGIVPPAIRGSDYFNVDLKGRVPQATLL